MFSASGTALLTKPPNGYSDPKLAQLFANGNGGSDGTSPSGTRKNIAAIIGGTVSGVVGAALFAILIWFIWLRRRQSQEKSSSMGSQEHMGNDFCDPTLRTNGDNEKVDKKASN